MKILNLEFIHPDPKRPWRAIAKYPGQGGWVMVSYRAWDRASRAQKYCDGWNEICKRSPIKKRIKYKIYRYPESQV